MEADFVNIFLEKQREVIVDLTSRSIMLEARVAYADQKARQSHSLIQELEETKQVLTAKVQDQQADIDQLNIQLTKKNTSNKPPMVG